MLEQVRSATSRRKFLVAAGTAVAGASIAARTRADEKSVPNPRLGLVTYNWGRDWDVPTVIRNCTATGFDGVELRSTHRHGVEVTLAPAARREVAKRFADSEVTLVGLGSACEYHSPDPAVVRRNIDETKAFVRLCTMSAEAG